MGGGVFAYARTSVCMNIYMYVYMGLIFFNFFFYFHSLLLALCPGQLCKSSQITIVATYIQRYITHTYISVHIILTMSSNRRQQHLLFPSFSAPSESYTQPHQRRWTSWLNFLVSLQQESSVVNSFLCTRLLVQMLTTRLCFHYFMRAVFRIQSFSRLLVDALLVQIEL